MVILLAVGPIGPLHNVAHAYTRFFFVVGLVALGKELFILMVVLLIEVELMELLRVELRYAIL